jgi:pimeloyl-ACP methyl ester carboxylesterase
MKVYCISGIAADKRAFKHIRVPEGFETVFIDWIKPFKNESVSDYAIRLAAGIDIREPFCLIGLSLGGIMASEIAIRCKPRVIVIIGSVPVFSELPSYYAWVRRFNIQKLVPGALYKWAAIVKHYFTREPAADKKEIFQMIRATDPAFIRWGIHAVLNWTNDQKPESLTHIHGTSDEVFPFKFARPTHIIPKGDHMLVISHPDEVNIIIREAFSKGG